MLSGLFDNTKTDSLANKFRRKRFKLFLELIKDKPKPVTVLDIGGTEIFWKMMGLYDPGRIKVTIVNKAIINVTLPNFIFIQKDATDLSGIKDKEFDIVFSNSVIEHVGSFAEQKKMAEEIIRTGKSYFIQTPNYYFPIEPHFIFPMFQFLPESIKILLIRNFNLGYHEKCKDRIKAKELVRSIRLLNKRELVSLFPEFKIFKERFLFFTKSLILYK